MIPSEVTYQYIEGVERLDYYVSGGYHPVSIGDRFCAERYTIINKLGFGRSATTWIAEDNQQKNRIVALKISTAKSAYRTQEEQTLLRLTEAKSQLLGRKTIQTIHDFISLYRTKWNSSMFLTDVGRANIAVAKECGPTGLINLPVVRAIVAQVILGVQFIHSQGLVHGGMYIAISSDLTSILKIN